MNRRSIWAVVVGFVIGWICLLPTGPAAAQTMSKNMVDITPIDLTQGSSGQGVTLPVNKARIVRLPADARDVLIANPEVADIIIKTPRVAYLFGRTVGVTNAFFFDGAGAEIARLEIRVELDVLAVQQAIRELIPSTDINVTAVQDNLFLTGSVRSNDIAMNAREIAQRFTTTDDAVFSMLTIIEDQQVLLQVRIAEVSRSVMKDLGLGVSGTVDIGDVATTFATGSLLTGAVTGAFGTARANYVSGGDRLTTEISALERNGLLKSLAEPNLTAISGETANFLAGGEFPIPVEIGRASCRERV